jgi:hypothetical protein
MKMKKTLAIVLVTVIAVSAFSFAASASAMPFMNWRTFGRMPGMMGRPGIQQNSTSLSGVITEWGTTDVIGGLQAQTRVVVLNDSSTRQGSSATAIWTTNTSRPLASIRARENFTYTFYTARLVNASVSALNVDGSDFFLNGTWNVFKVTTNFTIITNSAGDITSFHRDQDGVALATNAYGELKVTGNWANFTLTIDGVEPLTGLVPFKVNDENVNTVTTADLASVAKAYGSMPGYGNYDQRMDYNFDYKIDITDLATCAANVDVQ